MTEFQLRVEGGRVVAVGEACHGECKTNSRGPVTRTEFVDGRVIVHVCPKPDTLAALVARGLAWETE